MTETNGFDLSQLDGFLSAQEEGVEVDILDPRSGDPTGIKVLVASYESERVKAVRLGLANKLIAGKRKAKRTAEELEAEQLALTAALVVGWEGLMVDGAPLEASTANVKTVLKKHKWLREQIEEAAGDRSAFLTS